MCLQIVPNAHKAFYTIGIRFVCNREDQPAAGTCGASYRSKARVYTQLARLLLPILRHVKEGASNRE